MTYNLLIKLDNSHISPLFIVDSACIHFTHPLSNRERGQIYFHPLYRKVCHPLPTNYPCYFAVILSAAKNLINLVHQTLRLRLRVTFQIFMPLCAPEGHDGLPENENALPGLTRGRRGRHEVHGYPRHKMRPHHVELTHRYVPQPIPFSTFMASMTTLFSGRRR